MDSGTDTWVIVLAAFGGGLAGAVLQPLVSYALQLRTRQHDVEAEINQGLRRMLYAWMDRGTKTALLAIEVESKAVHGVPQPTTEDKASQLQLPPNIPTLQVWRIRDQGLQALAEEYMELVDELRAMCWRPTKDEARTTHLAQKMTDLPRQITSKMDELGWPEANWEAAE